MTSPPLDKQAMRLLSLHCIPNLWDANSFTDLGFLTEPPEISRASVEPYNRMFESEEGGVAPAETDAAPNCFRANRHFDQRRQPRKPRPPQPPKPRAR